MSDNLNDRQRRYVENVSRGQDSRTAALAAGYSESFSKVASHRLGKQPAIAKAIESIRQDARMAARYDLQVAMAEAQAAIDFATLHKNPMARVKAVELRAKLSGLLVDRIEQVTVDLTGALTAARERALQRDQSPVTPSLRNGVADPGGASREANQFVDQPAFKD